MKADVIIADCPWRFLNDRMKGRSAGTKYATMSVAELSALDVQSLAAKDCVLLLWAVPAMLPEALDVLRAWGFTYKTMLAWIKLTHSSAAEIADIPLPSSPDLLIELPQVVSPESLRPNMGMGWWVRGCFEPILIATRGKPRALDQWIGLISESMTHSRKPESLHIYGEQFGTSRLELFARKAVSGWTTIGHDLGSDVAEFIEVSKRPREGPADGYVE